MSEYPQLPRDQLNAIRWAAKCQNGNASLMERQTLRALIENGFIIFKPLSNSDSFPHQADAISRIPYLNTRAWEISGHPRREGLLRIVFRSEDPTNLRNRCEVEFRPEEPGTAIWTHGVRPPMSLISKHRTEHLRYPDTWTRWGCADLEAGLADLALILLVAGKHSGSRGITVSDQQFWWNDRLAEIPSGSLSGSAMKKIFEALEIPFIEVDERIVTSGYPNQPVKKPAMELA